MIVPLQILNIFKLLFTHYLYAHRRLDTNEYFYIGIGTKSKRSYTTQKSIYYRAHTTKGRNNIWHKIVNKVGYSVDILTESNYYDDIKEAEKIYILMYGKIINRTGILCNIADGGEGAYGVNKPKGKHNILSKEVHQYTLEGAYIQSWDNAQEVQRMLGIHANSICNCCNNIDNTKYKSVSGYQWRYIKENHISSITRYTNKGIYQYDKNYKLIKWWSSVKEASATLNINLDSIRFCATGRLKTYKRYIWSYDKK
jgi:hypothetical protein